MSASKRKRPGAIVINGERWPVVVLQVVESDPDGSPRTLRLLREDESTKIDGGESFWTVYGPPALNRRRN